MKKSIHPKYHPKAQIACACGKKFTIGSTVEKINVELCSSCHPLYTGKQKIVDTAGRVERFKKRLKQKKGLSSQRKGRRAKRTKAQKRKKQTRPVKLTS